MSKAGNGKIISISKAKTRYISIPADVAGDDRFPFQTGEEVTVTIEGERLLIEKKPE